MKPIDSEIAIGLAVRSLGRADRLDVVRPHPSGLFGGARDA